MKLNTYSSIPAGTQLDNYVIDYELGGGGFSIVYLAHVVDSDISVIIKEYMPRKLAERGEDERTVRPRTDQDREQFAHGQRMFLQEAGKLAGLKHPNIVHVINFFRENGTVYMVMEYEKGINLMEYIRRHDGKLSEKLLRAVFIPLLDGLDMIHAKGLLHLDIKPGNIYLRPGGNPLLLDFGAVHEMQQSRQFQPGQVLTPGFCPLEQSRAGGYVGPWSDIYAIGATMRACIEGKTPPSATDRYMNDTMIPAVQAFKKGYSKALLAAIDWAMDVDPELRPQSVEQFLDELNAGRGKSKGDKKRHFSGNDSVLQRLTNSLPWGKG